MDVGLPAKLGFTAKGEQPRESMAGKPAHQRGRRSSVARRDYVVPNCAASSL